MIENYEVFNSAVLTPFVIRFFEVVAKYSCNGLPETGGKTAAVLSDDVERRASHLPVYQFHKKTALRDGHIAEWLFKLLEEFPLIIVEVLFSFTVREFIGCKYTVCFTDNLSAFEGVRVNHLEVVHQAAVTSPIL